MFRHFHVVICRQLELWFEMFKSRPHTSGYRLVSSHEIPQEMFQIFRLYLSMGKSSVSDSCKCGPDSCT